MDPETHDCLSDNELKKVEAVLRKLYPYTGNTPDEFYIEENISGSSACSNSSKSSSALLNFKRDMGREFIYFLKINF